MNERLMNQKLRMPLREFDKPEYLDKDGLRTRSADELAHNKYKYHIEEEIRGQPILFDKDIAKWQRYHHESATRYPHGFRHYENFANYKKHFKDVTI